MIDKHISQQNIQTKQNRCTSINQLKCLIRLAWIWLDVCKKAKTSNFKCEQMFSPSCCWYGGPQLLSSNHHFSRKPSVHRMIERLLNGVFTFAKEEIFSQQCQVEVKTTVHLCLSKYHLLFKVKLYRDIKDLWSTHDIYKLKFF